MKVVELNNCIKYDFNKCKQCMSCIKTCPTRALFMFDGEVKIKNDKCYLCKKCINECNNYALYYNVNEGIYDGNGSVAVIPFNADQKFLTKKYNKVLNYELAEKIYCVETAFEMEKLSSKRINEEMALPLIITDVNNLENYLQIKKINSIKYLSKVRNIYTIAINLIKNEIANINTISLYGVPFETKNNLQEFEHISEFCDIPYKTKHKYNVLDIFNTYLSLCKFTCNINLEKLNFKNDIILECNNNYLSEKILFTQNINNLDAIDYSKYSFIFVVKEDNYILNSNLLKDEEINELYKTKYKQPGINISFIKKR